MDIVILQRKAMRINFRADFDVYKYVPNSALPDDRVTFIYKVNSNKLWGIKRSGRVGVSRFVG